MGKTGEAVTEQAEEGIHVSGHPCGRASHCEMLEPEFGNSQNWVMRAFTLGKGGGNYGR